MNTLAHGMVAPHAIRPVIARTAHKTAVVTLRSTLDRLGALLDPKQRSAAVAEPAIGPTVHAPDPALLKKQAKFVNRMLDYYFRLEISG
ncbi:MAG: hypothetical protein WCH60_01030, partial [Burkholderiales bacterium]